ncbi:hypothetical protein [Dysgonomonas termitidis]|uniref:Uncharacterized protein n=1 Tax=Dysgonomonas termitidis TaxID=1516126 RepID=A0ABV9KTV2_9BACT
MQYWNDIYTEIAEKITGLNERGKVDDITELATVKRPQDGDAVRVMSEKDTAGNSLIFRYTVKKNEYGIVVFEGWVNTGRISFEGKLPEIQFVDLWHEQVSFLTEELPFATPAVFIGFSSVNIEDRGQLVQDCDMQVDMYLFFETFSDTYQGSKTQSRALDYLNSLTRLHALFHGKDGETYSTMRRVYMGREESGGAGNLYRVSFQCNVVDYSAQHIYTESENPDAELEIEEGGVPVIEETPPLYDVG